MVNIFTAPDSTSQQMADSLPVGRAWGYKNNEDKNVRKLINSLAVAPNQAQQQIELLATEFNINTSVALLPDWETSVGLPDDCFGVGGTLAQRRQAVIDRLRKTPLVTLAELQAFVDRLYPTSGIILETSFPDTSFEYTFETLFTGAVADEFFLIARIPATENTFEYTFEMDFTAGVPGSFVCIMNKILPANVVLILEYLEE